VDKNDCSCAIYR